MSLQKLRAELHETIKQSRDMASAVNEALTVLLDESQSIDSVRKKVTKEIIVGLQAQDRLEQRCCAIEAIIDNISLSDFTTNEEVDSLWTGLTLDELSKPELSGKGTVESGEIEFF